MPTFATQHPATAAGAYLSGLREAARLAKLFGIDTCAYVKPPPAPQPIPPPAVASQAAALHNSQCNIPAPPAHGQGAGLGPHQ
jgi:hypothetical protein